MAQANRQSQGKTRNKVGHGIDIVSPYSAMKKCHEFEVPPGGGGFLTVTW